MEKFMVEEQQNILNAILSPEFGAAIKKAHPGTRVDSCLQRLEDAQRQTESSSVHACAYCDPLTAKVNLKCCGRWYVCVCVCVCVRVCTCVFAGLIVGVLKNISRILGEWLSWLTRDC